MTFPLTLVFMWLVFWRPQEWLLPWMYGWPVLDVIVYAALLGLAMEISLQATAPPKTPALMLAIGLWFATIMSHVSHTYFQGILDTYQETFKISLLLVLLMVVINSINRARGVVLMFLLAALVMSVHAILQDKTGVGFGGGKPLIWWNSDKDVWVQQSQFFGIFEDPNDFAQILITAMPLVLAYPKRLTPITLMMVAGVIWVISIALTTTGSRGAVVGLVAMGVCLLIMRLPARWIPYAAALGLATGLAICAFGGASLLDESALDRVAFWGDANYAFKKNPIFGIGYGMFTDITEESRAAHNAYVNCYTELGFFGYWFWFNLLTLGLIGCWRTRTAFRKPRNEAQAYLKRLSGLSIAAMAGFAASAYFISRAYVYPFFFLFGLLNIIPVIAKRYLPEDYPPLLDFKKDVLITGTLAAAGSIVYVYLSILILNRA
jgi:putative inorganic carbon (HCO3(-)) transporter